MALLPEPLARAMFLSTGGEANEAALRLAKLNTGGHEVLAFAGSWHGMTAGAASSTYSAGRRGYGPALPGTMALPTPNPYRCPIAHCRDRCDLTCLDAGLALTDAQSVGAPAAAIVEPILSAAASCRCPRATSRRSSSAARSAGCCSILDEAQTALGRVGTHVRVRAATTWCRTSSTLSKTLGGGLPLSATITTDAIEQDAFEKGFLHVTSHVSDPLPAAVGRAVLRTVLAEDLAARAVAMGARLRAGLEELQRRHEPIGRRARRGLMLGRRPRLRPRDARARRGLRHRGHRALPGAGPEREHRQVPGPGQRAADRAAAHDRARGHRPRARDPRSRAGRLPLSGQRVNAPRCPGRTIGRYTEPGAPACPKLPKPRPRSPSTRPQQVARANASGLQPVVFIHGLWLLPSSWDRWADGVRGGRLHARSRRAGPTTPRPSRRPTRTPRCSRARRSARSPTTSTRSSASSTSKPAVIGHSFGGLLTQILAGRGLAAVSVAIDPAPFRGVLPLPISALKSAQPGARQPRQPQPRGPAHLRAVPLRVRQRGQRGGGQGALRDLRGAGRRRAAVPGRDRQPQPVDRGQGRQQEPRARAAADHLRREGPHRPVGDRQRVLQEAEATTRA